MDPSNEVVLAVDDDDGDDKGIDGDDEGIDGDDAGVDIVEDPTKGPLLHTFAIEEHVCVWIAWHTS